VRTDPSADPGAEVEGGAASLTRMSPTFPFDLGTKAINLRGTMPRLFGRMPPHNLRTWQSHNSSFRFFL
jgi:hypothetical protein